MFPDHGVPHVHVFYGRPHERNPDVIVVRIQDATVLAGALPTLRLLRHALEYVRERREELLAAWVRLQKGQAPSKILPVRGSRQGSPVRVRAHITTRWPVRILLLERLGRGRVRMILADGRVSAKRYHCDSNVIVYEVVPVKTKIVPAPSSCGARISTGTSMLQPTPAGIGMLGPATGAVTP